MSIDVEVASGLLRGTIDEGIQIFRGVPHSAAPIGELRFLAPNRVERWHGIRDATKFAPPSIQAAFDVSGATPTISETDVIGSEDCLYLNIYAPLSLGSHPVLIWIHGGGGIMGSANDIDGTQLARNGVVVVSIAYRLGALGLLYSPRESHGSTQANIAILDQIAALAWVQENIHAFGGDPKRVTVVGQSNGARSIGTLLASPLATGLFSQAVMMSGTGAGFLVSDVTQAELVTSALIKELDIDLHGEFTLHTLSAKEIVNAQTRMVRSWPTILPFQAVLDEQIVPERPIDAIRSGKAKGIKMLIGTTHDEFESFSVGNAGLGSFRSMVVDDETLKKANEAYRQLLPSNWSDAEVLHQTMTSSDWWIPAIRVAEAHALTDGEVWMYRFDWRISPLHEGLGAPHGLDMAVMTPPDVPMDDLIPRDEDVQRFRLVIDEMRRALIAFVSVGDLSSFNWLPYETSRRSTFLFDDVSHSVLDPDRDMRNVWHDLL